MEPIVSIIMGSTSDLPVMEKAAKLLDEMHVPFEMNALSAHRTPEAVEEFAKNGTPHQYWLARGFILWADIYIRKGDPVQARVYLNSLQKNYQGDDNITEMIESRLAKLK